ncbi:MAG TPA: LptF/LptG family permease, partial [Candidatus Obscuribacterales bacterium]
IMFSKMGNYFGVAISIALVFIWYVTYSIFTSLGKAGTVTPLLAAWIQNIAFGSVGVLLLLQLSGVNFARWLLLPFRVLATPFVLLVRRLRRPKKA